jgi:site-specific DNA-cytosine methylase
VADRLHHIDLCSGIGGFAYAFQTVGLSRPVMFCDTDAWCRKVLAKHWPDVPITDDVKVIANDPDRFIPRTDPRKTILTAGYPCQPFSVAGKQKGTEDDRHIWPFISQIIAHKRPAFAVFENVYGHIALGLDEVLADLEAQDYATRAFIVPACGVNAPHRRDRLWIIAHTDSHGEPDGTINEKQGCRKLVGNSEHNGSSAATVSGKYGEDETGCKEGQSQAEQFEGASEPGHDAYVGTPRTTDGTGRGRASWTRKGAGSARRIPIWCLVQITSRSGENVADTGSDHQNNLTAAVFNPERMWPTPTTRDHKGGYQGGRVRNGKVSMDTLDVAVQHTDNQAKTGGQLNPQWVEWLMGYPEGWTDLKG